MAAAELFPICLVALAITGGRGSTGTEDGAPAAVVVLPTINTGVALAVALDMVTKPTSIPIAFGIVAVGVVLGFLAAPKRPVAVPSQPVAVPEG